MKLILLFFILLIHVVSWSQTPEYRSWKIGQKEGLPTSQIIDGFQCSRGFVWAITADGGLCRYNGVKVKTYTSAQNGLSNNFLSAGFETPDKLFWIVGGVFGEKLKKISIFNPITERAVSLSNYFKDALPLDVSKIRQVSKNKDGTIWVTDSEGKIYEYNGKKITLWSSRPKEYGGDIESKCYKLSDSIFCCTSSNTFFLGIAFFNKSGVLLEKQTIPEVDAYSCFHNALDDSPNSVIIECTYPNSVKKSIYTVALNKPSSFIDSISAKTDPTYAVHNKNIFVFTDHFINTFDSKMRLEYHIPISTKQTFRFFDKQDGLWLFGFYTNLNRLSRFSSPFKRYDCLALDSTCLLPSRGIVETSDKAVFITQRDGLMYVSKEQKLSLLRGNQKIFSDLFGMCLQRDEQQIWLVDKSGLWKIPTKDPSKMTYYVKGKSTILWQPFEDKSGRIWVGASDGLYWVNQQDSTLEFYDAGLKYKVLNESSVFAFYENEVGIWLATSNGIFLLDPKKGIVDWFHTNASADKQLPHNIIAHISEDKDGSFWLASKGGGLIHWFPNAGKYEQFTTVDGLSNNIIYAAYSDDYNQLWLPSNYGLMRFDKTTKKIILFLEEDGIPDLEFNTVSHFKAKDGTLYFGGLKGTISFHPKAFLLPKTLYPIQISDFKKINYNDEVYVTDLESILKTKTISLAPTDKSVELSFALLDFNNLNYIRYEYKIEGYDKNWQLLEQPTIKINTLPYGEYQLLLRVQTSGKPWQEFDYPITIKVLKPFYWQWWFLLLVAILSIILIMGLFWWRVANLEKGKKELEKIVVERTAEIAQQAEKLKNLDKVKSQFFANISHELRTPLTLILGPVSDLQSKPIGMLDEKLVRKNLELVHRNGQNLLILIEEVLELSKLESGKIALLEKPIHFKSYLQRIYSSFESLAELNNIRYRFDYNLSNNLTLLIDLQKMEKIVNNLLSNAFKFTPSNGEIVIGINETPNTIILSLKDSGSGINSIDLPHVFERFYQSKNPNLTAQGGTGIGLALCKELADLMNGQIWVNSVIDKGSHFFFEFPKKVTDSPILTNTITKELSKFAINEEQEWHSSPKTNTILLVEDNVDMRNFITSLLDFDYNIIVAKNGLEGLSILKEYSQNIDLIISDVMMPLMDGFGMMAQIKENALWQSLPVIMLTARAAEEDKLQALTIGVDDYLIKPFSSNELRVRIQNLLQNYEARKLWKQDLLIAANTVNTQQNKSNSTEDNTVSKEEKEDVITKQDLIWLKEVEHQIKESLNEEDFDMEQLAQKLFLSKRQLERKIKKITGLSPAKLVLEIRLQAARYSLEQGIYNSVSEVSFSIGIQTPDYFSKVYSKRFGKKPSDYFR